MPTLFKFRHHSVFLRLAMSVAVLLSVATRTAFAQTTGTATITGTVTDSSGAAVPNVAVVITNTDTSATRTINTNNDGSYTAAFLQPCHYEVLIGGGNFEKFDQKGIDLTV